MINTPPDAASPQPRDTEIERIVLAGPRGAVLLAGLATVLVLAMWFAFYLLVFLPRSVPQ